jgi:hypothetical protein
MHGCNVWLHRVSVVRRVPSGVPAMQYTGAGGAVKVGVP